MTKILILHVEAGHGHKKVAEAIQEEIESRHLPNVSVEVMDALDKTNWLFKHMYPLTYFQLVLWAPWLWGIFFYFTNFKFVYAFIAPLRYLWNRFQSGKLRKFLKAKRYDYILFTHFFPAEVCASAKARGELKSELITIVTDIIPHYVWNNPGTDEYWVMAKESAEALRKQGVSEVQIHVGGIPISQKFTKKQDRNELRKKFGLKPDLLTVLFTSGSFGIGPTELTLNEFAKLDGNIQALVVCGKNEHLYSTLNQKKYPFPVILFGFVNNMDEIMSASDLLVAKPGGATMCESLAKGIPMIISAAIPGQESYNAEWLTRHKAAFQAKGATEIKRLVVNMLDDPKLLQKTKENVASIAKPNASRDIANFLLDRIKYR